MTFLWEGSQPVERGGEQFLMEVKGCTLEIDGVGYFPDAPTERGVKHIRELVQISHLYAEGRKK